MRSSVQGKKEGLYHENVSKRVLVEEDTNIPPLQVEEGGTTGFPISWIERGEPYVSLTTTQGEDESRRRGRAAPPALSFPTGKGKKGRGRRGQAGSRLLGEGSEKKGGGEEGMCVFYY